MSRARVQCGIDRLLGDPRPILGKRIGLLAHPASITSDFQRSWQVLAKDARWSLVRLFGPEHGLDGAAQDMEGVDETHDASTGLPVTSLYGATEASLSPTTEQLSGLDAVVVDLVDVGARYYTFLATIGLLLRACAKSRLAVVICDRPNPLGGILIEGPRLDRDVRSFVGLFDTPVIHGLTPGEFAKWVVGTEKLDVELEVVTMSGWRRSMRWPDTGLSFLPPSPNMPAYETAMVYPGSCLVEATNLSEGRGTTRPFEQIGAPFLDGHALAAELERRDLPGVVARPVVFKPAFQKWAGRGCGGVFLHVVDPDRFRPFRTGCALVIAASKAAGFEWRTEPYEFVADRPAIDLLTGSSELRERIASGKDLEDWPGRWEKDEESWRAERDPYLLYRETQEPSSRSLNSAGYTLRCGNETPMLAFVGRHNSGKTTLLVDIVAEMVRRGFTIGTIKHTPHPVEMDRPGKDSRRHAEAGAVAVALVTPEAVQFRQRLGSPLPLREVADRYFANIPLDAILVEGYKTEDLPKIEVLRESVSRVPMCAADPGLAAFVSDFEFDAAVPRLPSADLPRITELVLKTLGLPR